MFRSRQTSRLRTLIVLPNERVQLSDELRVQLLLLGRGQLGKDCDDIPHIAILYPGAVVDIAVVDAALRCHDWKRRGKKGGGARFWAGSKIGGRRMAGPTALGPSGGNKGGRG